MVWLIIKLLSIVHIDIYIYTPLGPTVRETASASLSIPACKASLHSLPNNIFLGPAHTTKRGVLRTPNATVWFQRKGCNNKNSVVRNLEESERAKVKILILTENDEKEGFLLLGGKKKSEEERDTWLLMMYRGRQSLKKVEAHFFFFFFFKEFFFFYVWIEKWRLSPSLTETATAGYAVSAVAGSSAPAVLRY